ncbi:MAG: hypothetical protein Q8N05_21735 [Bacteroidota bacterium]|nr:hypothetical protein [Bacteroidota bacterium]
MKVFISFTFILFVHFQMNSAFGNTNEHIQKILNARKDTNKVKLLSDLCSTLDNGNAIASLAITTDGNKLYASIGSLYMKYEPAVTNVIYYE